ncbi:hypothetical protein ACIBI9_55840 [Nonomuraea sp. NPDC050451]|uniref:hypothetical protein n=1 Tax=Nonomuraea sp. NPDC050451 TaxID=3364364 RepID=UPI0037919EF2
MERESLGGRCVVSFRIPRDFKGSAQMDEVRAERDGSIEEFRVGKRSDRAQRVPGNWFVRDAVPTASGQVLVWAQPDRLLVHSRADRAREEDGRMPERPTGKYPA